MGRTRVMGILFTWHAEGKMKEEGVGLGEGGRMVKC